MEVPVSLLVWIVFGLVVGFLARAIMPGRQSMGVVGTTLLGIGGSLVGGLIGSLLTRQPYAMTHPTGAGFIGSLIGALLLLGIAGMVANRATPADRGV
jgi:uncharacterized membrane protein YeaQ/YmgE (transglycosylase-associated protein family)